jgi:hypothetical protein
LEAANIKGILNTYSFSKIALFFVLSHTGADQVMVFPSSDNKDK